MSVLDGLDATRICSRWSASLDDAAWVMSAPPLPRRAPVQVHPDRYSWWSLVRNPHAMMMTGLVGTVLAKDAMLHALVPALTRR
ncbi:MAG: hypothetical protein QOC66_3172 [Pseudonocardiales bacterium]|jgi:hypothetical protein|nr:hypothetical protein [Pseudonocardiales bacterium]